jgi:hypothetical protein
MTSFPRHNHGDVGDYSALDSNGKEGEPPYHHEQWQYPLGLRSLLLEIPFEYVFTGPDRTVTFGISPHNHAWHSDVTGAREVRIGDDFFSPALITINVGDIVRWTQIGKEW